MRKTILTLFATLVCILPACQVQEYDPEALSQPTTVQFVSMPLDTRVGFDASEGGLYPTLWNAGDRVSIELLSEYNHALTVTPDVSSDRRTITFDAGFGETSATDRFFAFCPAQAVMGRNDTCRLWNLLLPDTQTPQEHSPDPKSMLVWAQSEPFTSMPSTVELQFDHMTSYGRLYLDNLDLGDASLQAIELVSDAGLVGRRIFFLADAIKEGVEYKKGDFQMNTPSGTLILKTSSTQDIWFSCFPVDLSGTNLTITAKTDKGSISKSVIIPNGSKLVPGEVTTIHVDMTGLERVAPVVYQLVTSESELAVGDEVIIASFAFHKTTLEPLGDFAIINQQKMNNRAATPVTVTDGKIQDPTSNIEVFIIEAGAQPGTWAFRATKKAGYMYAGAEEYNVNQFRTGINGINVYDNSPIDNFDLRRSWAVSITDGIARIQSQLVSLDPTWSTVLQFNINEAIKETPNLMFSCYRDGKYSYFGSPSLYKKVSE